MREATMTSEHLSRLTDHADRRPGSSGNDAAVLYVSDRLRRQRRLGWRVETPSFDVVAWRSSGGSVRRGEDVVPVTPSPYGLGGTIRGSLVAASSLPDLSALGRSGAAAGQVLVLGGDITREPLTPQSFPFYAVEEHDALRTAIVGCRPAGIVAVTGRLPHLCGAVEPFAFIEDGDFPVPVADVTPADGEVLLSWLGDEVTMAVEAERWSARASNVVARGGRGPARALVVAHLDTKPGTPGALDNAAGVATLLRVAELLDGAAAVELLAVNGEDHYSAAGEVDYLTRLERDGGSLGDLTLVVNLDGAGRAGDDVAWSAYNVDGSSLDRVRGLLRRPGLVEGDQWWQSDHAVFAMRGRPAVAFTSADVAGAMAQVVHSGADVPDVVDTGVLDRLAAAVADLVRAAPDL